MISKLTRISDVYTFIDIGLKNTICHNCSGNSKKGPSCSRPFAEIMPPYMIYRFLSVVSHVECGITLVHGKS